MYVENNDRQIFLKRKTYPWLKILNRIATVIVVAGALNWGLIGLYDSNVVEYLFGTWMARIIYIVVGSSALIFSLNKAYQKIIMK